MTEVVEPKPPSPKSAKSSADLPSIKVIPKKSKLPKLPMNDIDATPRDLRSDLEKLKYYTQLYQTYVLGNKVI